MWPGHSLDNRARKRSRQAIFRYVLSFGLPTRSVAILPAATASKLMKTLTGWMLAPAARELLFQFICSCGDQPPRRDRHVEGESPNGVESLAGNAYDDGLTAYGDATTTRCRIAPE